MEEAGGGIMHEVWFERGRCALREKWTVDVSLIPARLW